MSLLRRPPAPTPTAAPFVYPAGLIFGPDTLATSAGKLTNWTGPSGMISASQTDPNHQPAVGSIGGVACPSFDGSTSFLNLDTAIDEPAVTLFVVCSLVGTTGGTFFGGTGGQFFGIQGGLFYYYAAGTAADAAVTLSATPAIFEATADSSGSATIYLDGSLLATAAARSNSQFQYLGSRQSDYLSGSMGSPLVFNRVLDDGEREAVRSYLRALYSLA